MKLSILGGGGARMPALVHLMASTRPPVFERIELFEPDPERRSSLGRLSVEVARALGDQTMVTVSDDIEGVLTDADFVFSAIRVGGDQGRVIDEQVALKRGLVGQETTGPGGCAMALRTIPVVLRHCEIVARVAPRAVIINFTNPAGLVTQAITAHGEVPVVGICDTPRELFRLLGEYLSRSASECSFSYGGLNHLGWVSSAVTDGEDALDELLRRYEDLCRFDASFAAFDPDLIRRIGAIPTEYLYYFYEPTRYVEHVTKASVSRGQEVRRFNERLVETVTAAFATGDVHDAWVAYSRVMDARNATYMRLDLTGSEAQMPQTKSDDVAPLTDPVSGIGGYEGVALQVASALMGHGAAEIAVNTRNADALSFIDADDVVETIAVVDRSGITPIGGVDLPPAARGLVLQVKEYERAVVDAAVTGSEALAATALALHPLVPGMSVAKDLLNEYRELHGRDLAYLD